MNARVEDVYRMRRFAEQVNAAVPALRRAYPAATVTIDRIAGDAADLDLRSHRPLTFAAVGEYSAGKSLLLSVLMGDPALLPVSEVPTTGNVTAIRLRPAAPGAAPRATAIRVGFLSRDAVGELVAHLLDSIRTLVSGNKLDYPIELLAGAQPTARDDGWKPVDDFARRVWAIQGLNPELSLTLAELVRIRDAWQVGQALLPATDPGQEHPVGPTVLRDAVEIGNSRTHPHSFPEPVSAFPFPANTPIDGKVVERLQPLIRRVAYDIEVPQDAWRFGPLLAEPGVELLDMPGLNSAGGGRDEWLALRELQHVTGLLVVLNAQRPEARSVLTLSSFLERARSSREQLVHSQIIVGQKFDALPTPPGDGRPDEFLSLERMTTRLSNRRAELVVYVSALANMAVRNMPVPPGVKAVQAHAIDASRAYWGQVAQAEPGRPDALALRAFAADGGIDGLRATIVEHVLRHGVTVHVTEMRAVRDRIRADLKALQGMSAGKVRPGDAEDRFLRVGAALTSASKALRVKIDEFRHIDRLIASDGRPVLTVLREAVAGADGVYGWEEWERLTSQVENGVVTHQTHPGPGAGPAAGNSHASWPPQYGPDDPTRSVFDDPTESVFDDPGFGGGFGGFGSGAGASYGAPVPTTTARFVDPFRETADRSNEALDTLVREGIATWTQAVRELTGDLNDLLARDRGALGFIAALTPGDPARGARNARMLGELASLKFVQSGLNHALRAVPPVDPETAFPLTAGRAYWWDPDAPRSGDAEKDALRRSHAVVLRTRCTLTEALVERLYQRLGSTMTELATRLRANLAQIEEAIPTAGDLRRLQRDARSAPPPEDDTIRCLLADGEDDATGTDGRDGWDGWAHE